MATLNNYKTEMSKLETYIAQQERSSRAPVTGDDFDFHINETLSIETSVLAHNDDSYTIDMDETAYNWLEEMGVFDESPITQEIVEDANTFNYAIEYHVGGVDSDATKVLRVIPVKETGIGPMYPEYVRAEIKKHPINKAMIEKGYRAGQTRGVWKGSIDAEIADAKEQLKLNLIAPRKQEYSRTVEDLEFVKRHLDGKEYKTSFGRETTEDIDEAEYQGREVNLGKPMSGDVRKFKVYVRDPKTGNTKKVNFGDPNMQIKRDDPKRRKSFRARHGCGTPRASDRTKAAYWSCRMWSTKPVSQILKGK